MRLTLPSIKNPPELCVLQHFDRHGPAQFTNELHTFSAKQLPLLPRTFARAASLNERNDFERPSPPPAGDLTSRDHNILASSARGIIHKLINETLGCLREPLLRAAASIRSKLR